jgi:hypothetical protein
MNTFDWIVVGIALVVFGGWLFINKFGDSMFK